jgi:CheY-like chemotaxis protein
MADADRLQQIAWNLLSNAVRFTPRGGRVTVTCDRAASVIEIRVQDTGAGIAAEHLPHVFERFKQIDSSTTRTHGGLGLGLAIVRHLAEAHGGSVEARSEGLGRGSTFVVTLPILAVMPAASTPATTTGDPASLAADPDEPPSNIEGVRVLVVDDEQDSLEVLREVLTLAGAEVTTVTSAREALHAVDATGPFDLIVSDIGMPETDGYELIRRVRAGGSGADVPAIALTAYARGTDAVLARSAGFQEHLVKPVDERRLLRAVGAWSRVRVKSG